MTLQVNVKRLLSLCAVLLLAYSASACMTELDFEEAPSDDGLLETEALDETGDASLQISVPTEDLLYEAGDSADFGSGGTCTSSSQCPFGQFCNGGVCGGRDSCTSSSQCAPGKKCRGGYCQSGDGIPSPCDNSASRAFGYMICKRLYPDDTNALTRCLQQVDRDYPRCGGPL